jgi:hypothetical protein
MSRPGLQTFKAEPPIRLVWENPAVPLLASMQISAVGLIDPTKFLFKHANAASLGCRNVGAARRIGELR